MRTAVSIISLSALLAACELQPPPPRPSGSPAQVQPIEPPPPGPTMEPPRPADAGVTPDARVMMEVTPECLKLGTHIAGVIIASAEPSQRTIFEAEKDRIVRSSAEVCTSQRWTAEAIACYAAATTQQGLKDCESKHPSPTRSGLPGRRGDQPPGLPQRDADGRFVEPGTPPARPKATDAPPRPRLRPRAGSGSAAR